MTVAELIAALQECPQDAPVHLQGEGWNTEITEVLTTQFGPGWRCWGAPLVVLAPTWRE